VPAIPSDEEFLAYNQGVISEFPRQSRRCQSAAVPDPAPDHDRGANRGPVTVPLGYAADERGRVFVMASKAGAPRHPAWFHNLRPTRR